MKKREKDMRIVLYVVRVFSLLALIYVFTYYNILIPKQLVPDHTGSMKIQHLILLISSILGYVASRYIHENLRLLRQKIYDNFPIEERLQLLAKKNPNKPCPFAEELHLKLKAIADKYDITRVKTRFISYDLLYYIKPGKWFGFTFCKDYRDDYIELKLGNLYHYLGSSVPELEIIGGYTEKIIKLNTAGIINSKIPSFSRKNIKDTMDIIQNTFESIINNLDSKIMKNEKEEVKDYLKGI